MLYPNSLEIRKVRNEDYAKIYEIHSESFDKSHFLTLLTKHLLVKYYEKIVRYNEYCFVVCNRKENEILGFLFAGYKTKLALQEFFNENSGEIIVELFKHPKFLLEKIKFSLSRLLKGPLKLKTELRLILIGVSTKAMGKGIAIQLLSYFENELKGESIRNYGLSVRKGNQRAINFYLKNNFEIEFTYLNSIYFYKEIE